VCFEAGGLLPNPGLATPSFAEVRREPAQELEGWLSSTYRRKS
jgi:hypothetical protein